MTWDAAMAWANGLTFGGYSDWRLPTMIDTGPPGCNRSYAGGTDCGFNVQTKAGDTVYSEMAYLWYVTLGNKAICPPGDETCANNYPPGSGLRNTGDLQNFYGAAFWYGLEYAPDTSYAWALTSHDGFQDVGSKFFQMSAMAVRDGDVLVSAIPEPETYALMLAGLAVVGAAARRRKAK
jgi:hypothetical protein